MNTISRQTLIEFIDRLTPDTQIFCLAETPRRELISLLQKGLRREYFQYITYDKHSTFEVWKHLPKHNNEKSLWYDSRESNERYQRGAHWRLSDNDTNNELLAIMMGEECLTYLRLRDDRGHQNFVAQIV